MGIQAFLMGLIVVSYSYAMAPQSRYLQADATTLKKAYELLSQNADQITQTIAHNEIIYELPRITNAAGILIGPEFTARHNPSKNTYEAFLTVNTQDNQGRFFTDLYDFNSDESKALFYLASRAPQTEVETESLYDNP